VAELYARTLKACDVDADLRRTMYSLLELYYDCTDWKRFNEDLDAKDAVIVLFDRSMHRLRGFSTLKTAEVARADGTLCRAVYSGDTVVEKAYWGQKVLGVAFLKYLWLQKAKRPFQPLYWFLISKGYKTYLLMANNFETHYPRYEKETPEGMKRLLDDIGSHFFPDHYQADLGLIEFESSLGQLKEGIAEVGDLKAVTHPRIRFFDKVNPKWREGVELACIAEMTFMMPLRYGLKKAWEQRIRPLLPSRLPASS
jgi:hypothetical protein